jgi:hypothetical protein
MFLLTKRAARCGGLLLAAMLTLGLSAAPARAADEVNDYLARVSVSLAEFLRSQGQKELSINFTGPPTFRTSASEGLVQMLSEKLRAEGVTAADVANFGFQGEFRPEEQGSGNEKSLVVRLSGRLTDKLGKPVERALPTGLVTKPQKIAEIFGLTINLLNALQPGPRTRDAFLHPEIQIVNGRQARAKGTPYGLEVLVNDEARRVREAKGLGYVSLDMGEEYQIRLVNDSDTEVVASLAVDGLSIFHFSEIRSTDPARLGEPKHRYHVVPARSSVTVTGWFKKPGRSMAFQITPFAEGAAAKLGRTTGIGVITATFLESRQERVPALPDTAAESLGSPRPTKSDPPARPPQVRIEKSVPTSGVEKPKKLSEERVPTKAVVPAPTAPKSRPTFGSPAPGSAPKGGSGPKAAPPPPGTGSRPKDSRPPVVGSPAAPSGGGASSAVAGNAGASVDAAPGSGEKVSTGFGRDTTNNLEVFKRVIGAEKATVSLRYERLAR